jgi:hypothetical protein
MFYRSIYTIRDNEWPLDVAWDKQRKNKSMNISRWPDFYTPPHRECKRLLLVWNHGRDRKTKKNRRKEVKERKINK